MSLCFKAYLKMDSNTGRDLKADVLQRGLITGRNITHEVRPGKSRRTEQV